MSQTVILDSCHSTSALREDNDPTQLVRGGFEVRDVHSDLDRHIWGDLETLKDLGRGTKVPASSLYGGLRSSVLLAACGEKESALERNDRGLFTQALLDALKKFGIDKLTYTSLLKRMSPLTQ
jgi:Caspase domain